MVSTLRQWFWLTAVALTACETQPTHEVISLSDLTPRQTEVGDRLVVHANGLPLASDIRRVSLTLTGVLHRPGGAICARPVSVTLSDPEEMGTITDPITGVERESSYAGTTTHTLRVEGGQRIEFTVTETLMRSLVTCPGERVDRGVEQVPHATLAFVGARAGISVRIETVQGTTLSSSHALLGPRVDLHTPWARSLEYERTARMSADRALDFMGLRLAAVHPPEGGLQVERVVPGSPADEAGIDDGDVLERLDGVTLLGISDFRPPPGIETSLVSLRRGDAVEDRPVRVAALTRGASTDVIAMAVLLCVCLALAFVSSSRSRGLIAWLTTRMPTVPFNVPTATGLRARIVSWRRSPFVLVAVITTALTVPFGEALLSLDIEVPLVHGLAVLASLAVAALGARALSATPSPGAVLGAMGRRLEFELPALVALVAVVWVSGEFGVQGVTASQGGAPWQWTVFRSPVLIALAGVYGSTLLGGLDEATHSSSPRWIRAIGWSLLGVRALLASALFLGGARVPGVSVNAQTEAVGLQMLGAMIWMLKTWSLVACGRALAPYVATVHPSVRSALVWRYLGPLAVIGLTLVLSCEPVSRELPATSWELAVLVSSLATFATVIVLAARYTFVLQRVTTTPRA